MGANAHTYKHLEFAFLSNSKAFIDITKMSVIIPIKRKIHPISHNIQLVWQY